MNGSIMPLWPTLLPPVCDQLWFTADFPKNEEAELAALEEELEQEKMQLKEQSKILSFFLITRILRNISQGLNSLLICFPLR